MYYAIKIWDKDDKFILEETTSILEDLPVVFGILDCQYPAAEGFQMRVLFIPETCYNIEREVFREAAGTSDVDIMQEAFYSTDEEFL